MAGVAAEELGATMQDSVSAEVPIDARRVTIAARLPEGRAPNCFERAADPPTTPVAAAGCDIGRSVNGAFMQVCSQFDRQSERYGPISYPNHLIAPLGEWCEPRQGGRNYGYSR